MDLSDLARPTVAAGGRMIEPLDPQALIAQLGSEVASTLSSALERVTTLSATGRIDRGSLRALREEIDLARRAGIMGQQVVRLGNGHVQLSSERLDLTALLREALRQRGREIDARGIEVRQQFAPAEVMSDATLLFSLLQTMLDWSFEHAVSRIDLKLDVKSWPAHARVGVGFSHRPADEIDTASGPLQPAEETAINTMSWRLLQQTAAVLGLLLQRIDNPGKTELTLEFPDTLAPRLPGLASLEPVERATQSHNSQPLAGRHVLVLASRREVRNVVREALRPMGLMIDFVTSVEEAQELCADGLPHAVIYEASLGGERFERLRGEMLAEVPNLAFIQLAEQGKAFEVLNVGGRQFASVGRDAIIESLPAALLFELSRNEEAAARTAKVTPQKPS
jgi:CheY-like chemotaxis protein